jgi:Ca2+/Na+ antiporter
MKIKYLPVAGLYILINVIVFIFKSGLQSYGFDTRFLLIANTILFFISLSGFLIQAKGLKSTNTNAFIRSVYVSFILKLFIVLIVVFAYVFLTKGKINKPSLFTSMGLYIVYTSIEVIQLMKIARRKPDA